MDKHQAISNFRRLLIDIENLHDNTTIYEDVSLQEVTRLQSHIGNMLYPSYSGQNSCSGCFANKAVKGGGCAILTVRPVKCKFKKTPAEYEAGWRRTRA